jgi:aryl-alcohol dehydrogenase-like predicted oxidoreductase
VLNYNSLAGGVLTGKYKYNEPLPTATRLSDSGAYQQRYYTQRALEIVGDFVKAAHQRGVTPAQLALAWVLAEPRVTSPILGARTLVQFNDSIQGLAIKLTPEERAEIPAVLPGRWVGKDPVYDRES